jgi:hypothetical protein
MLNTSDTLREYERAFGPFVHMSPAEKAIWLRFLQMGGTQFAPFSYDVRVGDGLQMPAGSTSYDIKAAAALTTKRIDVLYFIRTTAVIVEVKVRAGLGALGQLVGYRDLFLKGGTNGTDARMLLITDSLQPDVAQVLEQNGVAWQIV